MATDLDVLSLAAQLAMGLGLSAACGLRAFLPMFAMGIFERTGYLALGDHFTWMGSTPALVVFGSAVVIELLGDKFPGVDHVLDTAGIVVKPTAAAILASAAIVKMDPLLAAVLGLICGGAVAGGVHVAKSGTRLLSTTVTAGIANPFLSLAEDVAVVMLTLAAILAPVVAVVMIVAMAYVGYRIVKRLRPRRALAATA